MIAVYFYPRCPQRRDGLSEGKRLASCTFQSTLPREERHNYIRTNLPRRKFQSTLPREERLAALKLVQEGKEISIHAPTRGATDTPALRDKINEFQSTLPREERRKSAGPALAVKSFQSTLPREERPTSAATIIYFFFISIHAPKILAKQIYQFYQILFFQFQSTLPREERQGLPNRQIASSLFQSTLPREERR